MPLKVSAASGLDFVANVYVALACRQDGSPSLWNANTTESLRGVDSIPISTRSDEILGFFSSWGVTTL